MLVVAYNAETTLAETLDRIPEDVRARLAEIMIFDDASKDATLDVARKWRDSHPETKTVVVKHLDNLGYGGNQKAGYAAAIEHGLDIVVLLHGDGQYAPECLGEMVQPLLDDEADAVFGSRMMRKGAAREGGMPLYKYVGNRILTTAENKLLGSDLTEFHSGYRAYRVSVLKDLPIQQNTNDFDFDTQIIVQLVATGARIVEIPIPTYYGDEICYVNGVKYARDVIKDVVSYRLTKAGFGTNSWVPTDAEYGLKESEGSSHKIITAMFGELPPSRVLDVGCSGGQLSKLITEAGHKVTGLDVVEIPGVRDTVAEFVLADLEKGLVDQVGTGYDVVVAADVIEHVSDPQQLLSEMAQVVRPGGEVIISTPNFGHWYSRGRVALGLFDYDRRGILDATHLRFFMRRGLRRLFDRAGLKLVELNYSGLPFSVVSEAKPGPVGRVASAIDRGLVRLRPTLFGYQFVARLTPAGRPAKPQD